jgi:protein-arginine kinase activator protein McsA
MLCMLCKQNPAKVHLTQIVEDKMQKVDLCEECAKQKGVNDPASFSLADLLLGLGASQEIAQTASGVEFDARLRLYPGRFQKGRTPGLRAMLHHFCRGVGEPAQIHAQGHQARRQSPGRLAPGPGFERAPQTFAEKLDKAVTSEDFEQAASLRDEIKVHQGPTRQCGQVTNHEHSRISQPARRDRPAHRSARPDRHVQPRAAGAQFARDGLSRLGQKSERVKALEIIRPAVESLPQLSGAFSETMDNLGPLDKQILVERHLISREHAAKSSGSGLVLNKEESLCVMINEEDHLRMQALRPGLQLRQAWLAIDQVDSELERKLDYAFSPNWAI